LERLCLVGTRVRDNFLKHSKAGTRIATRCDDSYVRILAEAVTGKLGGKVGVAPRIFLKKLVADVLDRIDLYESFDPRVDYQLTIGDVELTAIERHAMAGTSVDEIELEL
ncbi:MAG: BREX system ATP-binding domain-containing protein, partial [Planctomycetota bacterium]